MLAAVSLFLSTLSLRRATGQNLINGIRRIISIHALLAESDTISRQTARSTPYFYPRSPCGERPLTVGVGALLSNIFLSTLSLRRATFRCRFLFRLLFHFYPRSPCGERRRNGQNINRGHTFLSTLSLRRATPGTSVFRGWSLFLSTLSLRRATAASVKTYHWIHISIHALLAESDGKAVTKRGNHRYFYPRSPCGERQDLLPSTTRRLTFLSTLSLRRATIIAGTRNRTIRISIHALLAESDPIIIRVCYYT